MRPAASAALALSVVALALTLAVPCAGAEPVRLCGRTAGSVTGLYFDVARQFDAKVLRADERETVIESPASETLWVFVVKPVEAVLCRPRGGEVASYCTAPSDACTGIVDRLARDPRAMP